MLSKENILSYYSMTLNFLQEKSMILKFTEEDKRQVKAANSFKMMLENIIKENNYL